MESGNDYERKVVEDYLKFFCIEECLDEALNTIAFERPKNPYLAIALFMETKTSHEILDISLSSFVCNMRCGVKATVTSNLGSFIAYSTNENGVELFKDFSTIQEKLKTILVGCDPTNLTLIDDQLLTIKDLDRAESFVISVACFRASARHKCMNVYEIIAALVGLIPEELSIPVPVIPVISRMMFAGLRASTQDVTLTALNAISFAHAMETLMVASANISNLDLFKSSPSNQSTSGCPCVDSSAINTILKAVRTNIVENGLAESVGLGFNFRASQMLKQPTSTTTNAAVMMNTGLMYNLDTSTPLIAKNGSEVVESLMGLWQETEFVSIERPLAEIDSMGMRQLRKRIKETIFDNKSIGSDNLKYCTGGVGGDADCSLQVILDEQLFLNISDFDAFLTEMPFNCVKLRLSSFRTMSSAIEVCKRVRKLNYALIVCGCDAVAETSESPAMAALHDPILADFAVGVGAGQFYGGGLHSIEFSEPYNRFLEISQNNSTLRYIGSDFRVQRR